MNYKQKGEEKQSNFTKDERFVVKYRKQIHLFKKLKKNYQQTEIFVFNNDHAFKNYASTNSEADLELICTSCQKGHVLHENKFIKDCDENCKECVIIDGKSTCIKCYETFAGFLKSLNGQGTCLQCPSNCLACLDRTLDEIYEINPYIILQFFFEQKYLQEINLGKQISDQYFFILLSNLKKFYYFNNFIFTIEIILFVN